MVVMDSFDRCILDVLKDDKHGKFRRLLREVGFSHSILKQHFVEAHVLQSTVLPP
jgi:hypothetical protein